MPSRPLAAIVLAAGQGTRMRADLPKVLHSLAGRPLLSHILSTVRAIGADPVIVVAGPGQQAVAAAADPAKVVLQDPPRGTADAVRVALPLLKDFQGDVLVLVGDAPLVQVETLKNLWAQRQKGPSVVVLGFRPADPAFYGRMVTDAKNRLLRIVEVKEATAEELTIDLCNSGSMIVESRCLAELIGKVDNKNSKGEYYLTDIITHAVEAGLDVGYAEAEAEHVVGINSQSELAAAEMVLQNRLRRAAMDAGVRMQDPSSVYLSFDTRFGKNVVLEPHVYFGPGVVVGDNVEIHAFSHLTGCVIGDGAAIGPFARLRPGAEIDACAKIGNFVEVKNATVGKGAKVNHLSYVGDASIGAKANIGAGVITCNYDGFGKYRTEIGEGAFIGSNAALVAPIKIGDNAIVGAGSTLTADVPAEALALARAGQSLKEGIVPKMRGQAAARAAAAKIKK